MSSLDDHVHNAMSGVLDSMRERLEAELNMSRDDILRAAQEAGTRIAAEVSERTKAEVRSEADAQLDEQRSRLTGEIESLQRSLEEIRSAAQESLETAERATDGVRQELEAAKLETEAARRELDTARQDAETARQDAETARQDTETARQEVESARRTIEISTDELETVRRTLATTTAELASTLQELESARGDLETARRSVEALRDVAGQTIMLSEAVRALDEAATFGDVLDQLAQVACRNAGRGAVFLVKGSSLRDCRLLGFEASSNPGMDFGESGLMGEAIRSGTGVRRHRATPQNMPEFARDQDVRDAAAWPLTVAGSVVAVLYADGPAADNLEEPYWPAFLEVLARHAGRVLEGITVRQATGLVIGPSGRRPPTSLMGQPAGSIQ